MKIYSGGDMEKVKKLHHKAKALPSVALKIHALVQEGVKNGAAKVFDLHHVENGTDIVLDFRLGTHFGQVYCRFDVVTDGNHPLGKYNFFFQTGDDENFSRQMRVFAVLFDANGKYVFGDRWMMDVAEEDTIGADFVYYLIGNLLGNIHEHLPKYTNTAKDIKAWTQQFLSPGASKGSGDQE